MPALAPPDVFGGATAARFGYTLRWVASNAEGTGDGTGSGVGAGAGNSWTLAQAMASAVAGHQVMVQDDGTYTLAADHNPAANGDTTSGFIVWAGTGNQNGADANGGRPLIDCNSGAFSFGVGDTTTWWENVEVANSTVNGMEIGLYSVVYNISSHNHTSDGIQVDAGAWIIACRCFSNGVYGINFTSSRGKALYNSCYSNTFSGISLGDGGIAAFNNCYDNSDDGIIAASIINLTLHNTIDGNTEHGIDVGVTTPFVSIGDIITDHDQASMRGIDEGLVAATFMWMAHFGTGALANTTDRAANTLRAGETTGDPDYTNAATGDFSVGTGDHADVEVGSLFVDTSPFITKGSTGRQEPAGGGGVPGNMTGGLQ